VTCHWTFHFLHFSFITLDSSFGSSLNLFVLKFVTTFVIKFLNNIVSSSIVVEYYAGNPIQLYRQHSLRVI
jgi:hypothetical protein